MLYALGLLSISCFLAIIALLAYVWTLKQGFGYRDAASAREVEQQNGRIIVVESTFATLKDRVQILADRPEAPAVEQYRKCLTEIEQLAHSVRTVELKLIENMESVRRTQNKLAARSKRDDHTETRKEIEELTSDGVMDEAVVIPTRRVFGRVR